MEGSGRRTHARTHTHTNISLAGSGKTLAFMLPILSALCVLRQAGAWPSAVKAVVLSPTNELAAQQARCLKLLLPGSGLRGAVLSKSTAAGSDFSKVDILLANPLRLLGMVDGRKIDLSEVCVSPSYHMYGGG
jgi:ATP-dependent RNA helicase DDX52/ROK1